MLRNAKKGELDTASMQWGDCVELVHEVFKKFTGTFRDALIKSKPDAELEVKEALQNATSKLVSVSFQV